MEQRAGKTAFRLPDGWIDNSIYTYVSPDQTWKISFFLDPHIQEPTPDAVMQDRLANAKAVLPGFRVEQPTAKVLVAGKEARVVTFDTQDSGQITRTCLLVIWLQAGRAIVVNGQGPAEQWKDFQPAWDEFIKSFAFSP